MRPKIICHMVSSIDGRLLVQRWTPPSNADSLSVIQTYEDVEAKLDAQGWIVGRRTMEEMAEGSPHRHTGSNSIHTGIHIVDHHGRNLAVAIDPRGKLHYGQGHIGGDHAVAVLAERVSQDYLAELREDGISYVFAGEFGDDLAQAMTTLGEAFGVRTLLLEGGGLINGAFLKAGLIDEISLLIYPGVDGLSGIPSIFEYQGSPHELPAAGQSLRHLSTETLAGGVVWVRYEVIRLATHQPR